MLVPQRRDLSEIEPLVCELIVKALRCAPNEVQLDSRLIEDLNYDSLDMMDLIFVMEEEFDVDLAENPSDPVSKKLFTRHSMRVRDLAEIIYLEQGRAEPNHRKQKPRIVPPDSNPSLPFTQLGSRFTENYPIADDVLYERLESNTEVPLYRRRSDGMRCFLLPAAEVTLGSDSAEAEVDERPPHTVSLSAFLIDAEPVSTTAYCRFLNSISPNQKQLRDWFVLDEGDDRIAQMPIDQTETGWRPVVGTETLPMVLVSWFGANAYSLWANGWEWRAYDTHAGFLPTEAQWEYAAQGAFPEEREAASFVAGQHQRGDTYVANTMPMAPVHVPLGQSKFGLNHMAGNVWQWCRDWYATDFYEQPASRGLDPVNTSETGIRSERGGSWVGPAELCRTTYRRGRAPLARGRCLGFRCVGNATGL